MAPRITQAIVALSGVIAGVAVIAAFSYFGQQDENNVLSNNNDQSADVTDNTGSHSTRLRRSRTSRRRRNRNASESPENNSNLTETEEDLDNRKMLSLFKEWSDDDNRNLLNLLHAISENQSRKEGFIHRGITCNKCNMSPIRGVRYKCANCIDFDLCEMCEGSNTHINTHIFLKIRIPIPPLANPRSALLPAFYPGKYHNKPPLSTEKYRELQHKSHFDKIELEALYEQFKSLSTVDRDEGGIDRETFKQCLGPLGLEKSLITERIFAFFDQDDDGVISFPEIVAGLSVLCKGNLDEKIEYAFRGYDLDGDGYISKDELYRMYKSYFYLSMELVRDVVSAMEDEMMDSFEFSASQPVSAAFNVAIPSTSSDRNNENDVEHEETDSEASDNSDCNTSFELQDEGARSNSSEYASSKAGPSNRPSKSKHKKYPLKEDHFLRQYAIEAEEAKALSNVSEEEMKDITDNLLRSDSQRFDIYKGLKGDHEHHTQLVRNQEQQSQQGKKAWEEKFPIMQTMSQGAIHEMVDKTFKSIKTEREGYINFEEFKECVQIDSSIVSWFEALGTVF